MKRVTLAVLLFLSIQAALFAQASTQVSGAVTDPSGAVIPNAVLELQNTETGIKRSTTADAGGAYSFVQVAPGQYNLSASANGFRSTTVHNLRLLVNNPATVNLKLEVGEVSESVSVTAEAVQINTTDASIGNAIGTRPIVQLPLNARNIVGLLALQPGVVFTSEGDTDSRNGAVNGGKSDQANVTLDGVDVNDQMDRQAFTSVLRMTPDSVQEFRVTTMNANADSGRTSGAQVVLVTKSGTNDLHGSLYEYHRNTATSANDFFRNSSGVPREKLIRNIFGASAGGPIVRNRLFIFGNFEGRRDRKDGTGLRQVPSLKMRQGILQYRRKDGSIAELTPADIASRIHPSGVNQAALKILQQYPEPNDYTVSTDLLNIQGYRFTAPTPLAWNTYISRLDYSLDQNSKHTVFLRGNLQNDRETLVAQFPGVQPRKFLRNNKGLGAGLTSVLSPALVSNFRYGITRQGSETTAVTAFAPVTFRGIDPIFDAGRAFASTIPTHTFSEDLNWIKGAHNVQFGAIARVIRNRRVDYQNSFSSASANASWLVGSGNVLTAAFPDAASADITYFRYAITAVMGLITQGNAQYNYKVDGTIIPQGAPVLRTFAANEFEMYVQDTWRLSRALTFTAGLRYSLMPPIHEANGQQVSPDVRIGDWFNTRGRLAQEGKSQMEAGRVSFVPVGQGGSDLYDFHKKNFAPRASLAYSPQADSGILRVLFGGPGKSSIRAGWGMYYDLFGSGLMRSFDATAFGLSTSLTNPAAVLTLDTAPRFTAVDQIPASILLPAPPARFPALYPDIFSITRGLDNTIVPPYSMNANFSIGRELGGGLKLEASYVGRFARRSLVRRDAAMPTDLKDPKSGMTYFQAATILARQVKAGVPVSEVQKVPFWENLYSKAATSTLSATQVVYNRFNANENDWTYALYQLDTGAGQGNCVSRNRCSDLGPYAFFHPQFSYLSVFSSIAGGNYHGAQLSLQKRFHSGDSVYANYTFSKSIDLRSNTERVGYSTGVIWNPWQPGLHKGVSDYDNTHLFNMMGVYSLPFGKGQRFASNARGALNHFIGGWQISGAWRWSSGFPVSVYETSYWPTNWNNNNWALWNGKPVAAGTTRNAPEIGGPNMFLNPKEAITSFDFEMPGGIGTRNPIRGDGIFNIDTNLAKRFVMPYADGKHSLQFRWETFNLTNTAKFDVATASADIAIGNSFGKYSSQLTQPRVMQFGLRYEF